MNKNFIIYLCVINIITFLAFGQDKWKAKNDEWRTSEKTLLGFACIGGSVGAWIGMHVFHHKTRKNEFRYGIPGNFCSAGDSYTDSIFGNLEVMKYTITNGKSYGIFFRKDSLVIRRLQWYDKPDM